MIPRVSAGNLKDIFGSSIPSSLKSRITVPGPSNFNEFDGIPRAWYPQHARSKLPRSLSSPDHDEFDEPTDSYF